MRALRLAPLAVLALAGCEGTPADRCQQAMDHLDVCALQYCETHDDDICQVLSQGRDGSLLGTTTNLCAQMTTAQVDHLATASCDVVVNEARLLAAGKADFPCPPYFPWCNKLAPGNAAYRVNVVEYKAGQAVLEVIIPDVGRAKLVKGGKSFQSLHLARSGAINEVGKPAIPTVSFLLGVPAATDTASVSGFEILDSQKIGNLVLVPAQKPVRDTDPTPAFEQDGAFYGRDAAYPGTEHEIGKIATWRNYRVVRVTVHPFQYNPGKKELTVATRLKVTVRFADDKQEKKDTADQGEGAQAGAYATTLVNYPEVAKADGAKKDQPERVRYLIIAVDTLTDGLKPLIDLKDGAGMKTQVVKLSELLADAKACTMVSECTAGSVCKDGKCVEPAKIKERISRAYQESQIEYALLVGDIDAIPMYRYEPSPGSWETIPSDYWYGLLAGDDLLSEVSIGRIPAKKAEDVAANVAKIVAYAGYDPAAAWRKRILLVAHEQEYPGKYTACLEAARNKAYKAGAVDFVRLYGGEKATTQQFLDAVGEGVGLVLYRGHGSEEAWSEWNGEDFSLGKFELKNPEKLPVVISVACLNASLQAEAMTHAEQWTLKPTIGAPSFFGATLPSWTKQNHDFAQHIFNSLLDDGVINLGPLTDRARAALVAQYGPGDSGAADNVKMYVWLGDPSLEVGQAYQKKVEVKVGWCNLQWPERLEVVPEGETDFAYGQLWINGVTEAIGQGKGVEAMLGWGPSGTDPIKGEGWTWAPAAYNADKGNNDEYMAKIKAPGAGLYSMAYRFKGANDADWTYCDMDGSHNGIDVTRLGVLAVTTTSGTTDK